MDSGKIHTVDMFIQSLRIIMGIHNDTDSNALEGEPVNVKKKKDKAKLIFKLLNYLGLKVVCFLKTKLHVQYELRNISTVL